MNKPSIEQYLISTCLSTIDELNLLYKHCDKTDLKIISDTKFNEMDITVRLGYPFRESAHYTIGDTNKKSKKTNHDIIVESKGFKIEVKYLKNWKSGSGTYSVSKPWSEYQTDFDWLFSEINNENKGKVAFVLGWFNCVDSLGQILQLGSGSGYKPLVNENRICYFPFLHRPAFPTYTSDLTYNYQLAYKPISLNLIGYNTDKYNCIFLGNENDCFHFAIYF